MATRISDKEISEATKMAQRANGVTVDDLASRLTVSHGRARQILKKTKAKTKRTPIEGTKASRVLTYSLAK